jgi:hypothetical protein
MNKKKVLSRINIIIIIPLIIILSKSENSIKLTLNPKKISSKELIFLQNSFLKPKNQNSYNEILNKKITEYSGKIIIGNPPQEFEFLFDTGSANIIVTSNLCLNEGCENKKKYNSSAFKNY